MGRPRHVIGVHLPIADRNLQWILVKCPGLPEYGQYLSTHVNNFWSTPLLLDVDSHEVLAPHRLRIQHESLVGTYGRTQENPCLHHYYDGDLYPFRHTDVHVDWKEWDYPNEDPDIDGWAYFFVTYNRWTDQLVNYVPMNKGDIYDEAGLPAFSRCFTYPVGGVEPTTATNAGGFTQRAYGEWALHRGDTVADGAISGVYRFERSVFRGTRSYCDATKRTSLCSFGIDRGTTYRVGTSLLDGVTCQWEGVYRWWDGSDVYPASGGGLAPTDGVPFVCISPVFRSPSLADPTAALKALQEKIVTITRDYPSRVLKAVPTRAAYAASKKAVEAFTFAQVNGIAFVADLVRLKKVLTPLVNAIRTRDPASLATLGLSARYGPRLTWQDLNTLTKSLGGLSGSIKSLDGYVRFRNSLQTRYGTSQGYSSDFNIRKFCADYIAWRYNARITGRMTVPGHLEDAPPIILLLHDMGLNLSCENLWDLIPYSFVLDWFTNLGALAEMFDYSALVDTFETREVVHSLHVQTRTAGWMFESIGLYGSLEFEHYSRYADQQIEPPPLGLDFSLEKLTDANLFTGALLLVQKAGK